MEFEDKTLAYLHLLFWSPKEMMKGVALPTKKKKNNGQK